MAPTRKSFKELNDKTKHFTVKVKVIEKTRERTSPNKTRYQRIHFQDDEGAKMQATIFGDNVAHYDKAVKFGKEYEISNARIKRIKEQYRTAEEEYEMEFVDTTIIRPLFQASSSDDVPEYCDIGAIPRIVESEDRHDVLGIVLYIGMLCTLRLPSSSGETREVLVRELIITDCSVIDNGPMIISVWDDLAVEKCEKIAGLLDPIPIIGLTALKSSSHKGYSLSTTVSTSIIVDPEGDKAKSLAQWLQQNEDVVTSLKEYVHEARNPANKCTVKPISDVTNKKVTYTLQDEEMWICGWMMKVEERSVRLYLGCDKCGRKSDEDQGVAFSCKYPSCKNRSSTSVARITFAFDLYDETASISLTAFSDDASKLLGKDADAFYSMSYQARNQFLVEVAKVHKERVIYAQVTPATAFAINRIMRWTLKAVSFTKPSLNNEVYSKHGAVQ